MAPVNKQQIFNQAGSSRARRHLPALDPDFFKVDDKTLVDFLVFAEKYAAFVYADGYPELGKQKTKSWSAFFDGDISVFLSRLITDKPGKKISYRFKRGAVKPPQAVLEKLDSFFWFLPRLSAPEPNIRQLDTIYQKALFLLGQLGELKLAAVEVLNTCREMGITWNYKFEPAANTGAQNLLVTPLPGFAKLDATLDAFLQKSHKVIVWSRELFDLSMNNNQHHDPAMALFIAFLKLYEYAQEDLNLVTGKHLDYFYKTILNQRIKPPEPDNVVVCLKLSDHINNWILDKGTLFKAGIDEDGLDCMYEAIEELEVNKTSVTGMGSIYISINEEVTMESHFEFISAIYESTLQQSTTGEFTFPPGTNAFPTFGEDQQDIHLKSMKPSDVGFAIASPVLMLRDGTRKIKLGIQFQKKSMSPLISFFERYSKAEKMSAVDVFHKVFYNAFTISLSTSKGWYRVNDYNVLPPDWSSGKVEFSFVLPNGAPAIEPMGEDWDMRDIASYATEWPVLKFTFSDQKTMNAYSYLQHLIVNEYEIQVDVSGIKNLEVYNDLGKVETSKPFYPFGPQPIVGSSFVVGHDELGKKNISELGLEITWHNLPRDAGGFADYYKDYDDDIDNSSFKVGITALSNYEFHPSSPEKRQVLQLFDTDTQSDQSSLSRPAPKTVFNDINVKLLKINDEIIKIPLQPFDSTTKSGYLKLELVAPEMGFGINEYPAVAARKILERSKSGELRIPNPPYIPQIKSFALNYKGSTTISFEQFVRSRANPQAGEKVYQLQPFGIRTIFENATVLVETLLPQFNYNGYLILGLENVTPGQAVSFYFVLEPNKIIEADAVIPEIEWMYVLSNHWVPFDKRSVLSDTTSRFTTSGIISLRIPAQMSSANTILPDNRFWIIAAIKGNPKWTARIRGVYTQAVTLKWKPHKPGAEWSENIPAGVIESLLQSRSEVATVFQPMPSFGGRPKEDIRDFYTRVSERLRHKNRGVTSWDIERLVLENFPAVNQVKCISPIEYNEVPAGSITLVVAPRVINEWETPWPKFSPGELVDIQNHVRRVVSPFVKIRVINPTYEEVKVTATVVLQDKESRGNVEDQLHHDIRSFISPWYADRTEEMQFGGSVNVEEFAEFLNRRPYLRFTSGVSVLVVHYNEGAYSVSDLDAINTSKQTLRSSKPWSVLVPMKVHKITVLEESAYLPPEKAAIENMRLGSEFIVSSPGKEEEFVLPDDTVAGHESFVLDIEI